jgi:hypothetical protein
MTYEAVTIDVQGTQRKIPTGLNPAGKVSGKVPNLKSIFSVIPVFCCGAKARLEEWSKVTVIT